MVPIPIQKWKIEADEMRFIRPMAEYTLWDKRKKLRHKRTVGHF